MQNLTVLNIVEKLQLGQNEIITALSDLYFNISNKHFGTASTQLGKEYYWRNL